MSSDVTFGVEPGLRAADLEAFFNEWPRRPSNDSIDAMLKGSYRVMVGRLDGEVMAFANSISDGTMFAYIPFVEVHADHPRPRDRHRPDARDARRARGDARRRPVVRSRARAVLRTR